MGPGVVSSVTARGRGLAANPALSSRPFVSGPGSAEDPEERPDSGRSAGAGPGGHLGAAAVTPTVPSEACLRRVELLLGGSPSLRWEVRRL